LSLPRLTAPEPLASSHRLGDFRCGEDSLDEWLKRRALKNQESGASRTYVVCAERKVVGYYCLAAGSVENAVSPPRVRRNMPSNIPVMVIGRLAVHRDWHGRGLGRDLVRDALLRTLNAAEIAGIRAVLVHALSDPVRVFYAGCGFRPSPTNPMTLMATLADVNKALDPEA
jgi:GNAT superfamily N-acetyltransferase